MSRKKILYSFLFIKLGIALSAILISYCLFGGTVNNNIPGNDFRGSGESTLDSTGCTDLSNDSLKRFVRFDHTDGVFNYYSIRLSMFNSSFERGSFYEAAKSGEIYMMDKSEFDKDSTLFMTGNTDKVRTLHLFCDLYEQTINSNQPSLFPGSRQVRPAMSPLIMPTCDGAEVACSSNIYTFPAGTTGSAPPPVGGYPNYGCLGSEPCPAYFYMQVGVAGSIVIFIQQSNNHDVDFICWGPFTSLTDGCATGLTGTCNIPTQPSCCNNTDHGCTHFYPRGNITDCSYSPNATETCHILNAQVGEIYILLITNFSQQPGTITFQQTGGTGVTNCEIVVHCSMIAITANPSTCDGLTNTFSISGNVEFSNPPPTGTLTITDNTAVPVVSQTFSPPFVSPLAYDLTGIPCNGAVHSLTAVFSDSTNCTLTQQCTSPPASCPQAHISGGGEICNDGTSMVPISISLLGFGPYNFTYAINGVSQPAINNYSGASPYVFNTNIPGTYTLVSVSNSVCPGSGPVSGSATVIVDLLPLPTITGSGSVCAGTSGVIYITQAGMTNYSWTISPGGTITSGGTGSDNTITVTWNTAGAQSISINYTDLKGCTAASAFVFPVTVNPLPVPVITGTNIICAESTGTIYSTQAGMSDYKWNISAGGTITSGGTNIDNTVTVTWNTAGAQTVSVNYTDANTCTAIAPVSYPVTVHPLPVPAISGLALVCVGSTGVIYSTQPGMTNYQWTVSGGGSVTAGGTATNNSVTITWNAPGAQSVSVNYHDANGCTAASPTVYPVTVNPIPGVAGMITGTAVLCQASTGIAYSVGAVSSAISYSWTLVPGTAGTITGNTNSITIDWSSAFSGTASLTVKGVNNCGNGTSSPAFSILVNPKPFISFIMCTDSITIPTARIIQLREGIPPGGTYTGAGVNTATGTFDPAAAGIGAHIITYSYTNVNSCVNSASRIITVINPDLFVCGGNLKDVRDNKLYNTVLIGAQCWMAESFNYGTAIVSTKDQFDNCTPEKYCYADNPANCTNYGGFYQWDELMAYSDVSGSQGICPPSWHVPTEAEWTLLFSNFINNGFAGSALKATGYSGFNALIEGVNFFNHGYNFNNFAGFYWSSDSHGAYKAWAHGMNSFNASVSFYPSSRSNAFSVRCIRD
jgi:uncharacterized protein (TIGR02145 family)